MLIKTYSYAFNPLSEVGNRLVSVKFENNLKRFLI